MVEAVSFPHVFHAETSLPAPSPDRLSFAQERLWIIDQLIEDKALYNASMRFALDGDLDIGVFERALGEVIHRHDVLRTGFSREDGRPSVAGKVPPELEILDLRGLADADEARRSHQWSIAARPFDLHHPPLFRAALYRLDERRHELLLTVHHIIFDGASIDILLQELEQIYPAFLAGLPSPLPALGMQSGDVAEAERQRLSGERRERLLAYWRSHLGGDLPVLTLPTDRPRPPVQGYRGGTIGRVLDDGLVALLETTCRKERVTPFMLMLAAYAAWLCRYANQQEVVIGSPFALRGDKDSRNLIGFFVNTLGLRVAVDAGVPFRSLLHEARRLCMDAYPYAELPFGELVGALDAGHGSAHPPLFQAMLAVQNRRRPAQFSPSLRASYLGELPIDKARFDLSMVLDFLQEETVLSLEYNADLFDSGSAERMLDHFLVLLRAALDQPELAVGRLPLMGKEELARWKAWSRQPGASVPDMCVHRIFEAVAEGQPDAIAVRQGTQSLSYHELNTQASRLAADLADSGLTPGELVAICLPRTQAFLIAVLAIWKAGAAYVPLDPELPPARHAFIVGDAGVARVITEMRYASRFADGSLGVLCLDDAIVAERLARTTLPARSASDAGALAYAIYTSGSTGEPKGVLVEHRAVSRLLGNPAQLGYGPDTVMLQSINTAFDASVLETWAPLCCGGQLVMYPGQGLDVAALQPLIDAYGINTLTLPASLLDLWSEQWRGATGLARIVVGGEALSAETVARLYALDGEVVVVNHYGPTENGILSSYYPIPRPVEGPVPIGFPVPGTDLLVLSDRGQPQPPGVTGELYVAGQGLARGYLGRPELTRERFAAADPALTDSALWYRTGDLVRWQCDGDGRAVLQFVGRGDQQVKIRGFRIELGEIEVRLRACDGVQDARATVHQLTGGDKQLVAYVIAADDDHQGWRRQLQQDLPAYMVPAAFVRVPAWPLTQNGKLDLKALPPPDRNAYSQKPFAGPETDTEHRLLAIWQRLLKVDRISIDDNFFELGGHSLLATRLHNAIRADFDSALPLRTLFESPSIRQLAACLTMPSRPDDNDSEPRLPALPPIVRSDADHAPLSYAQQRLWFIQHLDSDGAQYHIPYRLCVTGELDVEALRLALGDLVARHAILRTVFREIGGEPRQLILPAEDFALPLHDLSGLAEPERQREAERLLHAEAMTPFDLSREPALRGRLLQLAQERHWLALTVHHIVADGWAMEVLQRELAAFYAARRASAPNSLPPLRLQYADYASWQRRWLDERALAPQLDYWQERLQDIPLLHNLPLDRPRPSVQSYRGALHLQQLPAMLVARVQELAHRCNATLFMGLHSTFALLLSRYSGESDIVVGTPVANRRDEALAPLVGLFINTLVLRSDLSGNPRFIDFLAQGRADALEAYEHQDLPFELLVERVNPARNASYSPVFQILFALQNNDGDEPSLPGLTVEPLPFAERYAKFDLALNLRPHANGILAEWEYNADLFDAQSVEQMASSYATLLEAVVETPGAHVRELPLLDAEGVRRTLALGNNTERAYDEQDCLHALIERQVAAAPQAVAIVHGGTELSYADLNHAANRLACRLRRLGVGPDVPVAIAMTRSPALVVTLLAVLKAGGAYVPLDAGYPQARLAVMLADSAPAAVLVDGATRPRIEDAMAEAGIGGGTPVLDVVDDADQWSNEPSDNLPVQDVGLASTHVAYIIYTSGSTGRPKGVMNEHRGIVNRLRWMQEAYPLDAGDSFLQTAAIGFGASVVEIFWPLLAGARLLLTEEDGHKDPAYLHALIEREKATALHFVPSMLQAFLDHPQDGRRTSLKRIFCGGEPLSGTLARRCRERLPGTRLVHLYGSSETAVLSTGWDCPETGDVPDNLPIGKAGANTRIYILDESGYPVPRGVRGEIHVAGRQVARGYLRRPELDVERFLPDPYQGQPGARMYRSGDLGRMRADGNIEHLGRNDFQIKIRGQRVEIGDIEAALHAVPGVHQVVVIARSDDGDVRLVAYLVPSDALASDLALQQACYAHLAAHLPAHMLPSAFVVLPSMPLNANGKLDREALPVPQANIPVGDSQPPENDLQRQLLELWKELLKQPQLGIANDFFEAGGHSLLALRLANRLRESFEYELDLKAFFAAPNVKALAEAIQRQRLARQSIQHFDDSDVSDIVEF